MKSVLLFLAMAATSSLALAEITETPVDYTSAGTTCEGIHVHDSAKTGKLPAVLIVHQWTGLSENEKMRGRMLAELGYNVFLADIYGKGVRPGGPPGAAKEAAKYKTDRKLYRQRLNDALAVLTSQPETDTSKVAAIGYCFGGTGVIELARSGAKLNGVVSFHGGLDSPTPADGKNIHCEVLALHGADDPHVPAADVQAFEDELNAAGVKYLLIKYPGAVHAFTQKSAGNDNSKGAAYNKDADQKSWAAMMEFFGRVLK